MSDKRTRSASGSIQTFDDKTLSGVVLVDGRELRFHSTSFSCHPARFPKQGENVQVTLIDRGDGHDLVALRAI